MPQLEHIEAIEKRLWTAADTLRANSNYASNEYFLPVMGLVFLRHAYSRYLNVKDAIEANLPKRGGKARALTKEDFSQQSAIFLQPKAQFDTLVALTDSDDRARAIIEAMESIEADYGSLRGVLPKSEYQELDNAVLGQLLRTLNSLYDSENGYTPAAVNTFLQVADYWLVAHALANGQVVVTHEKLADTAHKVKIPNVFVGFGIKVMTPFEMLRHERARFVLGAG